MSVIKCLNILKDGLAGRFTGRIKPPVYDIFFQDGKETLAPRVISRSADSKRIYTPISYAFRSGFDFLTVFEGEPHIVFIINSSVVNKAAPQLFVKIGK